jgi:hypothetical protein
VRSRLGESLQRRNRENRRVHVCKRFTIAPCRQEKQATPCTPGIVPGCVSTQEMGGFSRRRLSRSRWGWASTLPHTAGAGWCWLVMAGAGWCWLVLGGHLGGRRAQVERLRGGEHLRHLRCRLALRLLLQLLERLAAGLALRACARVKGAGVGEPRGAHTATPARVESSKASPRHRPREDGLTLQTLQDPVLLPPWVCFQDGGFSKHER